MNPPKKTLEDNFKVHSEEDFSLDQKSHDRTDNKFYDNSTSTLCVELNDESHIIDPSKR